MFPKNYFGYLSGACHDLDVGNDLGAVVVISYSCELEVLIIYSHEVVE